MIPYIDVENTQFPVIAGGAIVRFGALGYSPKVIVLARYEPEWGHVEIAYGPYGKFSVSIQMGTANRVHTFQRIILPDGYYFVVEIAYVDVGCALRISSPRRHTQLFADPFGMFKSRFLLGFDSYKVLPPDPLIEEVLRIEPEKHNLNEMELLFMWRLKELASLQSSAQYYDKLKAAAILRQLVKDDQSLALAVKPRTYKLTFPAFTGNPFAAMDVTGHTGFHTVEHLSRKPVDLITVDRLLKLPCVSLEGDTANFGEVIDLFANVYGGVHYNPKKRDKARDRLDHLQKSYVAFDSPLIGERVAELSRIVIKGLAPLARLLLEEAAGRQTAPGS